MLSIRLSGLTHDFDGRLVFDSLSFESECHTLAVHGPNGSGKSTLLRILAGLLTPTEGRAELLLDGTPAARASLRALVGLAAPDVRLYAELTPRENIAFLMKSRGLKVESRAINDALLRVGLSDRADDPVSELSSGLARRACLATAIAHSPVCLLLDEPGANLDEDGASMVRSLIEEHTKQGMVVLATNDPEEAAMCDVHLNLGARR